MIRINDKLYNIKDWGTLTIEQAQQLSNLELPEKMKKLYMAASEDKYHEISGKITPVDAKDFGDYSGEVLKIMSDIPGELIDYMQYYDRNNLYEYYCRDKIISLMSDIPFYVPKNIENFKFDGVNYLVPKGLKVFDRFLPCYSENSLVFIEGHTLFKAYMETKDLGNIRMMIAVYCRPEGEDYNEKKAIERGEGFKKLPMYVAWEVFFCICVLSIISIRTISMFYPRMAKSGGQSLKKAA